MCDNQDESTLNANIDQNEQIYPKQVIPEVDNKELPEDPIQPMLAVSRWSETLLELLYLQYQTQSSCDLLIKCASGLEFKVHQSILECCFNLSSLGHLTEPNVLLVHPTVSEESLTSITRFLYTGHIISTEGLLETARQLGFTLLAAALEFHELSSDEPKNNVQETDNHEYGPSSAMHTHATDVSSQTITNYVNDDMSSSSQSNIETPYQSVSTFQSNDDQGYVTITSMNNNITHLPSYEGSISQSMSQELSNEIYLPSSMMNNEIIIGESGTPLSLQLASLPLNNSPQQSLHSTLNGLIYSQSKISPVPNTSNPHSIQSNDFVHNHNIGFEDDSNRSTILKTGQQSGSFPLDSESPNNGSLTIMIKNGDNSYSQIHEAVEVNYPSYNSFDPADKVPSSAITDKTESDKYYFKHPIIKVSSRSLEHIEVTKSRTGDAFDALFNSTNIADGNTDANKTTVSVISGKPSPPSTSNYYVPSRKSALVPPTNSQILAKANAAVRRRGHNEDPTPRPTRFVFEEGKEDLPSPTSGSGICSWETSIGDLSKLVSEDDTSVRCNASIELPNVSKSTNMGSTEVCMELDLNNSVIIPSVSESSESRDLIKVAHESIFGYPVSNSFHYGSSNSLTHARNNQKRISLSTDLPNYKRSKLQTIIQEEEFSIGSPVSESVIKHYGRGNSASAKSVNQVTATRSSNEINFHTKPERSSTGLVSMVNCYEIKTNSTSLDIVSAKTTAKKTGIVVDGGSTSISKSEHSNHTKIIHEIFKKYPNLVKDKKNLKLRILRKNSTGNDIPANGRQPSVSALQKNTDSLTLSVPQSLIKPTSSNTSVFSCTKCSATRPTYQLLEQHIKKKHELCSTEVLKDIGKNLFRCDLCIENPSFFPTERARELHINEMHNRTELRSCRFCGYRNVRKLPMAYHMYVKHKVEPPRSITFPKCDLCDFVALNQSELVRHRSNHPANDTFKCHTCSVSFRSLGALQGHLQATTCQHKQTVSHECPHCSRTFAKSYSLKVHVRTVHKSVNSKPKITTISSILESTEDGQSNLNVCSGEIEIETSANLSSVGAHETISYNDSINSTSLNPYASSASNTSSSEISSEISMSSDGRVLETSQGSNQPISINDIEGVSLHESCSVELPTQGQTTDTNNLFSMNILPNGFSPGQLVEVPSNSQCLLTQPQQPQQLMYFTYQLPSNADNGANAPSSSMALPSYLSLPIGSIFSSVLTPVSSESKDALATNSSVNDSDLQQLTEVIPSVAATTSTDNNYAVVIASEATSMNQLN